MINLFRKPKKGTVHYLHIGKTGGTAVKAGLRKYRKKADYLIELHGHQTKLTDVPPGDFAIFFLRDPISRFISGFYSRKRKGQPRYYNEWSPEEAEVFAVFSTPGELAAALADDSSAHHQLAIKGMQNIFHLSHYSDWYKDEDYFNQRLDSILFVGFQESLSADFATLKKILGISRWAKLPSSEVVSHRNPADVDKSIPDSAMPRLKQWYQADYAFVEKCRSLMQTRSAAAESN